ncbi:MAG: Na+/H+ antiporter subunit E [Acidimicrobiales bacterium]
MALSVIALWVALWGDLTWANIASGVAVSLAVLVVSPTGTSGVRIRPLGALRFGLVFLLKLVESTFVVAWEVVTPKNRIREAIVAVPLGDLPDVVVTAAANAVSLTPGTLTLEVVRDPTVMYVHVLHLDSVEGAREAVYAMVDLACGAFGCPVPVRVDTRLAEESP